MGPATSQARQLVLDLRQLDLGARFAGARLSNEQIEDQRAAVDDGALDDLLQVLDLIGRQVVVEDDDVGTQRVGLTSDLAGLTATDERSGVGRSSVLQASAHHLHAGASGELRQLVEILFDNEAGLCWQRQAHQEGARRWLFGSVCQTIIVARAAASRSSQSGLLRRWSTDLVSWTLTKGA